MSIAVCLLLYSLVVLVAGPPLLRALTRHGHAPRFGVAAWLTAIATVVLIWLAVAGGVTVEVASHWDYPRLVAASCLDRLRGVVAVVGESAGLTAQFTVGAIVVATALMTTFAGRRLARTISGMRVRAEEHAEAVRLVGRRTGDPDVVIVEAAEPAAYCVSGRPSAIVVTSAAVAVLDYDELAAVLAHERAHLTGHHSLVVTTLRALATVFPKLTLMREGATEVSRLLEMCADDASARRCGSAALLSGLITLCRAAPAGALAAADVAVLARAERLAAPSADPAIGRARAALTSVIAVLAVGPVVTVMLAAAGALLCRM
ncbi:M56 family metallopeptidase [Mycobacterium intracellulare]|uniref:M56 family metallopeptidase n=1 Tax=Mycobacterium intracellulare TaxID=1767 RepID=UPI00080B13D7|nr:M56 family metallopeptidase [Mycobacterium intracellulare]OCB23446.1 peptidase M48 [Mycobacterium intracellulare subsp. yongonense]